MNRLDPKTKEPANIGFDLGGFSSFGRTPCPPGAAALAQGALRTPPGLEEFARGTTPESINSTPLHRTPCPPAALVGGMEKQPALSVMPSMSYLGRGPRQEVSPPPGLIEGGVAFRPPGLDEYLGMSRGATTVEGLTTPPLLQLPEGAQLEFREGPNAASASSDFEFGNSRDGLVQSPV
ncbi:unnamed protein product, partial [Amoebophrya sp. A25]